MHVAIKRCFGLAGISPSGIIAVLSFQGLIVVLGLHDVFAN